MMDRRIEIEAIKTRIAQLKLRLFEFQCDEPPEVLVALDKNEYYTVAEFGWHKSDSSIAIRGRYLSDGGKTGGYKFMIDRRALRGLRNRDVFSYWEDVLKHTIRHLAREMYDPEQEMRERVKNG